MTEQIATQTNNKEETQVNSGVGSDSFSVCGPLPTQTLVASSLFDIVYKSWARGLKEKVRRKNKVSNLILGCLDNSREQGNWIPSLFAPFWSYAFFF
jgi:hypothetical protein